METTHYLWGVAILKVTEPDEAEAIVRNDPAVLAGLFEPRIHPMSVGILVP